MKKVWLLPIVLLLIILTVAFLTKPDDKACIIGGVKAVWGKMVPDEKATPDRFNEFMDLSSESVVVRDRILYKQVIYHVKGKEKTVAIGAFKNIFATVKSFETDSYIPPMPAS